MKLTLEKLLELINVEEGIPVPMNLHDGIKRVNDAFSSYRAYHHPELSGFNAFIAEIESTDSIHE